MAVRVDWEHRADLLGENTVASAWISTTLDAFRQLGHDPEPWRAAAGIAADQLDDPETRVPGDSLVRLWNQALDAVGDPLLGVRAGSVATWRLNHITTLLVVSATDLGSAVEAGVEHQHLTGRQGMLELRREPAVTRILMHRLDGGLPLSDSQFEFSVTTIVVLLRLCVGRTLRPAAVRLDHEPLGPRRVYEELLDAPVVFGEPVTSIDLNNSDLSIPTLHRDPALHRQFRARAAVEELRASSTPVPVRAARFIEEQLGGPYCNIEAAAAHLGMSERSLQRALAAEGLTFRDLLDRQRCITDAQLSQGGFADDEIARLLGFADSRSLERARRRWDAEQG